MKINRKIYLSIIELFLIVFGAFFFNTQSVNAKTSTVTRNYDYYWRLNCYCGNCRWFDSGYVSVTHRIYESRNLNNLNIGETVDFTYSPDKPFFTASGGAWDTPYGAWCENINSRCGGSWQRFYPVHGGWEGKVLWTAVKPDVYMSSSNPSVIKCSGMACTAVGPGNATLTAHIGKTKARIWALAKNRDGWWWVSEGRGSWRHGSGKKHSCGCCDRIGNTMYLPKTHMSWGANVINPNPTVDLKINGLDDPISLKYNSSATLSWTSKYADSCTASDGWSGSKSLKGSQSTGNLTSSKKYTIRCSNSRGSATDSVRVNIVNSSPRITTPPTPLRQSYNTLSFSSTRKGDYCTTPAQFFSWVYSDSDGDPESRYQFQVDNNSDFSSPEINRDYSGLSNPSPTVNTQSAYVHSDLAYNTLYHWRVKVYDSHGNSSGWVEGPSFKTEAHHYPVPDFDWSPNQIYMGQAISFLDKSICYGSNNSQTACSAWSWHIPGSTYQNNTNSRSQNPIVQFTSLNRKSVSLSVSDGKYICSISKNINVKMPLPHWKEVKP